MAPWRPRCGPVKSFAFMDSSLPAFGNADGHKCWHRFRTATPPEVMGTANMSMVDTLGTLCEDLCIYAMNQGIAVLYGKRLCVVRREGGSWPFAVVRRKRDGMLLCHVRGGAWWTVARSGS